MAPRREKDTRQGGRSAIGDLIESINSAGNNTRKQIKVLKEMITETLQGVDGTGLLQHLKPFVSSSDVEVRRLLYTFLSQCSIVKGNQTSLISSELSYLVQTTRDPLLRAATIRALTSFQHPDAVEDAIKPIKEKLQDSNPFVRQAAVLAACRLASINYERVKSEELPMIIREMIVDGNASVVSAALRASAEFAVLESKAFGSSTDIITTVPSHVDLDDTEITHAINALSDANDSSQSLILQALSAANITTEELATRVMDGVAPFLTVSNHSVSFNAVKTIVSLLLRYPMEGQKRRSQVLDKCGNALLSQLNGIPEVQYCILKAIPALRAKFPELLRGNANHFFIRYYDPLEVKIAKIDCLLSITSTSPEIAEPLLSELQSYILDVDSELAKRAVQATGQIAFLPDFIKLHGRVKSGADALDDIPTKVVTVLAKALPRVSPEVAQEIVCALRDIFRAVPNRFEGIIVVLCDFLDKLDEPRGREALIWILGEYAPLIENIADLVPWFAEVFFDETSRVQLAILTATAMVATANEGSHEDVREVFTAASTRATDPDVRAQAIMYQRLFETDRELLNEVMRMPKPKPSPPQFWGVSSDIDVDVVLFSLGSVASILNVDSSKVTNPVLYNSDVRIGGGEMAIDLAKLDEMEVGDMAPSAAVPVVDAAVPMGGEFEEQFVASEQPTVAPAQSSLDDILGLGSGPTTQSPIPEAVPVSQPAPSGGMDAFDALIGGGAQTAQPSSISPEVEAAAAAFGGFRDITQFMLAPTDLSGVTIAAVAAVFRDTPSLLLRFGGSAPGYSADSNFLSTCFSGINKNPIGIASTSQQLDASVGGPCAVVPLSLSPNNIGPDSANGQIQVAIKFPQGSQPFIFAVTVPITLFNSTISKPAITMEQYPPMYQQLENQSVSFIATVHRGNDSLSGLENKGIHIVTTRPRPDGGQNVFFSMATRDANSGQNVVFVGMAETQHMGKPNCFLVNLRCANVALLDMAKATLNALL